LSEKKLISGVATVGVSDVFGAVSMSSVNHLRNVRDSHQNALDHAKARVSQLQTQLAQSREKLQVKSIKK
jgi:hypothetical protein